MMRITVFLLFCALVVAGFNPQSVMNTKNWIESQLLSYGWAYGLKQGRETQPLPWTSNTLVARLMIPARNFDTFILASTTAEHPGSGPVWHQGSEKPGDTGISLIYGDASSSFSVLRHMNLTDKIILETLSGMSKPYAVEAIKIIDQPELRLADADRTSLLVLTADFPVRGGAPYEHLRLAVIAREIFPVIASIAP